MTTVEPGIAASGSLGPDGPRGGPTVLRMLLGIQLRRFREASGVTPDEAGYEIRASRSKISRMENGRVGFKDRDVADLLTLYGVADIQVRAGLLSLARQANAQSWWAGYSDLLADWFQGYLGLEEAASLIGAYELQFVHGLLQTTDYARAVFMIGRKRAPAETIERLVSVRMQRQRLLTAPAPPRLWAVMDETALRRPIGGREVMRAQLKHLVAAAELPNVTLQLLPLRRGGHAAGGGSFTILQFAEPDLPDAVYIEQLTSASYLEKREDVDYYCQVMDLLGTQAETPAATVKALARAIRTI